MRLRIGTWNCRQALDTKMDALRELRCDIVVVQECAEKVAQSFDSHAPWKGDFHDKGLGVFAFGGWKLEAMDDPDPHTWLLPVRATSPTGDYEFTLLGAWTVKRHGDGRPSYAGQITKTIDRHEHLLRKGPTVLAGDFNASAQTVKSQDHKQNIERLEALGVRSAFHHHHGLAHGDEQAMTLRWSRNKREYHCDFVFLSSDLQQRLVGVEVGDMSLWVGPTRSDHCPVVVEFDLGADQIESVR